MRAKSLRIFIVAPLLLLVIIGSSQKSPTTTPAKPSTGAANKNKSAETQKALFDKFFLLSDGDTAELAQKTKLATAIFKGDSTSKYFLYVVSWASIISKKYEPVGSYIESIIEKNPAFAEAYYLKGLYLYYTDQSGFIEQVQKCIELNPKLSTPYYFLAGEYYDTKKYKLSLTYYDLLEKVDPKHKSLYYNRANTKNRMEDHKGAVEDFTKALIQKPTDYRILYNRGDTYLILKNYTAAEKDFTDFIKLMPKYATAWYNRGLAKFYQSRPSEACDDFKMAVQLGYTEAADYVSKNCK